MVDWNLYILIGSALLVCVAVLIHGVRLAFDLGGEPLQSGAKGVPTARGSYQRGDKEGHWIFYDADGRKDCEGNYVGGFEDGVWTFFHPNLKPRAQGNLNGWNRLGPWGFWDEEGRPISEEAYLERYPDRSDGTCFPKRGDGPQPPPAEG